ncbi:serine/threonine protein kinase [Streptomyces pharetrae CZA14]|uniref:non-specific serine/threonine protein kinase n=1 Tax=Streptomyces pharetrae CZA14 TaxID=1144883 RepID=A0ABX3YID1_9ACTN|nr:serine/threonine protein kinase [Streptomyces pharetrae CZA14]
MRLRQSASALSRCSAEVLGGRYRLDEVIGSGGAGDVHRGFDLRLKRPVAVKVFRVGTGVDMEERFHNEAVILARLQHPGLVTVYDAGRHNGRAYLVMELIEGPTLKARISAGPLAPGETAALGADLARALAHAHEAGIVHRDVKPSNIILDATGRPHLTDFGISRLLDATTHTATGTLVGTAAYLSPEQVLGQPVGPSADVYALGLVLLECITSRLEYDGAPLEAAIARLHRRPHLPDSLPEELAVLLRDMTSLEARDRPAAVDCARALTAMADTTGPVAVPCPADVTSLVPRQAPARADRTHQRPPHTAGATMPKAPPARRRLLAAGGAAAVAAAMAATLAVSDGFPDQGGGDHTTRAAAGSPSAKAEPRGTSRTGNEEGRATATPSTSDASTRDAPTRQLHAPAPGQRPGVTSAAPSREQVTEAGTHGTTAPPSHSPAAGASRSQDTATETSETQGPARTAAPGPGERPEKPRKTEKPHQDKGPKRKSD